MSSFSFPREDSRKKEQGEASLLVPSKDGDVPSHLLLQPANQGVLSAPPFLPDCEAGTKATSLFLACDQIYTWDLSTWR